MVRVVCGRNLRGSIPVVPATVVISVAEGSNVEERGIMAAEAREERNVVAWINEALMLSGFWASKCKLNQKESTRSRRLSVWL